MVRLILAICALATAPNFAVAQASRNVLIDQAAAQRHGLTRAWFSYLNVGGAQSPIVDVKFDRGTLFIQTGIATTHAIDGDSGRTLWVAQAGAARHPSLPLGVSETHVAVVNGTTLYVLDRATGQIEFTNTLHGVPSVGAAVTDEAVFVPNEAGQVEVYSVKDEDHRNLANLRLEGRDLTQPAVSYLGVAVGSGRGDVGLANLSGTKLAFRFPTNFAFEASPAAWGPRIYAGNSGGLLYCFDDLSGRETWSFAAGSPITHTPVAFSDAVYVLCQDLTMYRVSAQTGNEEWVAKDIRNFLAASPTRIYASDKFGRLAVLSAKTGALIDRVSMPAFAFPVTNNQTDQIFLATERGLIQSLHEVELTKRVEYHPPPKEEAKPEPAAPPVPRESKSAQKAPPADTPPEKKKPASQPPIPAENPFAPAPDAKPNAEANPFGAR
jgi:putative pyrroloquinoline-quinone binding quinoprotein